jgi:uncharacterized Zn-finger protein
MSDKNEMKLQKCARCKCLKKKEFFKIRLNTGVYYKTCMKCCGRFRCDQCEFTYTTKSTLKQHIKSVHDKIKDHECDLCDYTCSHKGVLNQHIKSVHDKIKDHECDLCEFKCSNKGDLKQHIKQVHDKIKDHECDLCEFKCSIKGDLKQHIKQVHDKIKDHECDLCDYKCSAKGTLTQHIKQVHDKIKDIECDLCDYTCSLKSTLTRHIKICTGKRKISSGELRVINSLSDLGFIEDDDYIFNHTHVELTQYSGQNMRPDFVFKDHKIMIEYDGEQHERPVCFGGISKELSEEYFEKQKAYDALKDEYCDKFGYKMIRISYRDFTRVLDILSIELHDIIDWYG